MRMLLATAALAAVTLAAPAAAQPDGRAVLRGALEQLEANAGPRVRDYTLALVHDTVRMPAYVVREGPRWSVRLTPEGPLDMTAMAVFWPEFSAMAADPERMARVDSAVYLREETVEGRRAHVVALWRSAELLAQGVDSVLYYVDAETRQLLRLSVATLPMATEETAALGPDARMLITLDAAEYRETDGLVLPRAVRVRMRLHAPGLDHETLQGLRDEFAAELEDARASSDPEAAELAAMFQWFTQLFSDSGVEVRSTIEDVRVNSGPPAWLDSADP